MTVPRHYAAGLADSARWEGFEFRSDDIVISTPSKCGTTWMQMILALLVFHRPELPAPLTTLSPWFDMTGHPVEELRARLAAQRHRRFIKTHTPLDGLPTAPGVTYIVVGRNPLDVAVSIDNHRNNLDLGTTLRLVGRSPMPPGVIPSTQRDRVMAWIESTNEVTSTVSTLPLVVWHLADAWARRHQPNVVLVHYADLRRDLPAMMQTIAARLGITVPADRLDTLVEAATLPRMRARADELVPDERLDLFTDNTAFFGDTATDRSREILTPADHARYEERLAELAPAELVPWLRDGVGSASTEAW